MPTILYSPSVLKPSHPQSTSWHSTRLILPLGCALRWWQSDPAVGQPPNEDCGVAPGVQVELSGVLADKTPLALGNIG